MRAYTACRASIVATVAALSSGAASAHEGLHLAAHAHPHLGAEHLLAMAALGVVVYCLARRLVRR